MHGVPSLILVSSLCTALRELNPAFLALADDRRPDDRVIGVAEVETLVAASVISFKLRVHTGQRARLTSELLDPDAGRILAGFACLARVHPEIRTIQGAGGPSSCAHVSPAHPQTVKHRSLHDLTNFEWHELVENGGTRPDRTFFEEL